MYKCEVVFLMCTIISKTTEPIAFISFSREENFPRKYLSVFIFYNFLKYFNEIEKTINQKDRCSALEVFINITSAIVYLFRLISIVFHETENIEVREITNASQVPETQRKCCLSLRCFQ